MQQRKDSRLYPLGNLYDLVKLTIYRDQTRDIKHLMNQQQSITHKVLLTFSNRLSGVKFTYSCWIDLHPDRSN
jgi:hypothetical protein